MKKVLSLLLVVAMVFAAVGCSAAPSGEAAAPSNASAGTEAATSAEPVTISWAINETANLTREQYMVIVDEFEKAHPEIKVDLQLYNTGEADYLTKIAAGTLCDVNHDVAGIANVDGALLEVPEWLSSKWDSQYLFTVDGKINSVPVCGQGQMCVVYHKDAFTAAGLEEPTTWEEFIKVCDTFVANGQAPLMGYGAASADWFSQVWCLYSLSNVLKSGYDDVNAALRNGSAKWTDQAITDAVSQFQSWNANGYFYEGSASLDYTNATVEFQNGATPMMIDGVWSLTGLDPEAYGMFFVPDGTKLSEMFTCYWGVSAASEHPDAAWTFIDWVLTGDGLKYYTEQILAKDAQVSLVKDAPSYDMDPLVAEFYDLLMNDMTAYISVFLAGGDAALPSGFAAYVYSEMSKVFFENADVSATMAEIQTEYETFLSEQG